MNDFTKEELQIVYDFFDRHKQDSYDDYRYSSLLNKIDSMIDNYCDHAHLDDYDLFLPRVGAILTDEKKTDLNKLQLIKKTYLKTVWPEKVENKHE
jgi:hypothetical protein